MQRSRVHKLLDSEKNRYTLYGALFGLLFPLAATSFEAVSSLGSFSLENAIAVQSQSALLWIIDSAPIFLGLFARWIGIRQDRLAQQGEILRRQNKLLVQAGEQATSQLGQLWDNSEDELYLFLPDTLQIEQINQRALQNHGHPREEMLQRTLFDLATGTDRETLESWLSPLRHGEQKQVTFQQIHRRKDGSEYPMEMRVQHYSAGSQPVLLGMAHDIADREREHQRLVAERQKLLDMLENLPLAFHLQAPDYSVPYANKLFRERFRAPENIPCYSLMHQRDEPCEVCSTFRVFDGEERVTSEWNALDGRTYLTVCTPYTEIDGSPLVMEMAMDITDQEIAKQQALVARDQAEKANRAKSEFLSRMSHELRTPMNAILGFGQLLQIEGDLDSSQKKRVDYMMTAGHQLLELIDEVLDLAHVDSGKLKLSLEAVELGGLVEELVSLMQPLADQRELELSRSGPSIPMHALVDRGRLRQVLLNLLSNAVKYNREGGKIDISYGRNGSRRLWVQVEDSGIGLSEEQMLGLFEPFSRVATDAAKVQGTGIGLSISKQLVEAMDGTIAVDGTLGSGSRFRVELPEAQAP